MKTLTAMITAMFIFTSTLAFAGGDKNQYRHDGAKGKGPTHQKRVNK